MKIAFTFLTYGKNIFGGIENALFNLTKGLSETGDEPLVFASEPYAKTLGSKPPAKVFTSNKLPQKYSGDIAETINHLEKNAKAINRDFETFLDLYKPEAVIVVDPIWGIIQCTGYVKDLDIPVIMSYHVANAWPQTRPAMVQSLNLQYHKYLVVSQFLAREIKNKFSEAQLLDFTIIPNSVDVSAYNLNLPRENYIFSNSRITKGKDVDILVKAFQNITKDFDIHLKLCAGNSPFANNKSELAKVKSLVKKYGIQDRVEFLPQLNWDQVPEIISKAKIVVLTSSYETFGIAALEASVAGTPLIASASENFESLVKDTAIFFEPRNIDDLSAKLREVLKNYKDYEKLAYSKRKTYYCYDNKLVAKRLKNEICNHNLL